jgi:hypothetical protein
LKLQQRSRQTTLEMLGGNTGQRVEEKLPTEFLT